MEITHIENQPVKVLDAIVCDICGCRVFSSDLEEFNNVIRLGGLGGYNSEIGDETRWTLDACEKCFIKHFGPFIKREAESYTKDNL